MKYINKAISADGYYSVIQQTASNKLPDGCAKWPDDLDTTVFYEYNGFVTLIIEDNTVVEYYPNEEARDAYFSNLPEPQVDPEPIDEYTTDEIVNALIGYEG